MACGIQTVRIRTCFIPSACLGLNCLGMLQVACLIFQTMFTWIPVLLKTWQPPELMQMLHCKPEKSLTLTGPLPIDDTAWTLLFKAKLGALFPVVILLMLAFSIAAALLKGTGSSEFATVSLVCLFSLPMLRFAVLFQLHVLPCQEARGLRLLSLMSGAGPTRPPEYLFPLPRPRERRLKS